MDKIMEVIAPLIEQITKAWKSAEVIWIAGGWGMAAIAFNGLVLFSLAVHVQLKLSSKRFNRVSEDEWRRWIDRPDEREGAIGEILDFVMGGRTIKETGLLFQGLRTAEISPIERDLKIVKICVGTAPLLGLFGTVTDMLATFGALATGSGGEKTMAAVARGISEALITTETGLVIALPGLFIQYRLARRKEQYKAFLAHLETVCTQHVYKRERARGTAA